jgi:phosphoribosylamine--glycine ligase
MGAYSPVPFVADDVIATVMERAIGPTLAELARRGAEYRGVLYCGLMLTADGPKVLEYNIRLGDPECQVLVPRLASDLYVHFYECARGRVETPIALGDIAAVGVVLASGGYPSLPPRKGDVIEGLDAATARDGVRVFHASTDIDEAGRIVTNGGRVLTVVGTGPDVLAARARVYEAAADISWPGVHYRRDIAAQALT